MRGEQLGHSWNGADPLALCRSEDLGTRVVSVHDVTGRLVWSKVRPLPPPPRPVQLTPLPQTRALSDTEIVETIWVRSLP